VDDKRWGRGGEEGRGVVEKSKKMRKSWKREVGQGALSGEGGGERVRKLSVATWKCSEGKTKKCVIRPTRKRGPVSQSWGGKS